MLNAKVLFYTPLMQLFHHKRELTPADDSKTLLDMNMHTGFALAGYDMVRQCICTSNA